MTQPRTFHLQSAQKLHVKMLPFSNRCRLSSNHLQEEKVRGCWLYIYQYILLCNLKYILLVFIFRKRAPCIQLYATSGNIYMCYHCVIGQSFASQVSEGCMDRTDRLKTIKHRSRTRQEQTEQCCASVRPAIQQMSAFVTEPESSKWVIKSPPLDTILSDLHLHSIFDLQDPS